jgi:hypothetical protein
MQQNYKIIRSDRKTVGLEVTREGEVIVRAPRHCTDAQIELFVSNHADWIAGGIERQRQRAEAHPEPTPEQRAALIARAKEYLPRRVQYFASVMELMPTGITITGARTRFGSCSPKNRLSFSWRLMQYPDAAIDYVVVHELAHIVHKNHGKMFYALIESVLPDYKARIRLLRE